MQNPAAFISQMRALPHFVNGKTDGFSISQVAPGSVFDQLGLQNGDLLTEIDGKPVTNPMQAMGLMQSIKTASAIDLTISRFMIGSVATESCLEQSSVGTQIM